MRSRHCSRMRCHRSYKKGTCECRCAACVKLTRENSTVKMPPEMPFSDEELRLLRESPFKGPNAPWPGK